MLSFEWVLWWVFSRRIFHQLLEKNFAVILWRSFMTERAKVDAVDKLTLENLKWACITKSKGYLSEIMDCLISVWNKKYYKFGYGARPGKIVGVRNYLTWISREIKKLGTKLNAGEFESTAYTDHIVWTLVFLASQNPNSSEAKAKFENLVQQLNVIRHCVPVAAARIEERRMGAAC